MLSSPPLDKFSPVSPQTNRPDDKLSYVDLVPEPLFVHKGSHDVQTTTTLRTDEVGGFRISLLPSRQSLHHHSESDNPVDLDTNWPQMSPFDTAGLNKTGECKDAGIRPILRLVCDSKLDLTHGYCTASYEDTFLIRISDSVSQATIRPSERQSKEQASKRVTPEHHHDSSPTDLELPRQVCQQDAIASPASSLYSTATSTKMLEKSTHPDIVSECRTCSPGNSPATIQAFQFITQMPGSLPLYYL